MRAVICGLVALAGCAEARPAVVDQPASGLIAPEGRGERLELTDAHRRELLAAMRSVAPGHRPVQPPLAATVAEGRIRWRDVPAAARAASREMELAVTDAVETDDAWRFTLRSIEDWPGTLLVERRPPPEQYAASATIGRFPELPERKARAEALVKALREKLLAYGKRRAFEGR